MNGSIRTSVSEIVKLISFIVFVFSVVAVVVIYFFVCFLVGGKYSWVEVIRFRVFIVVIF